ncbi:MAG TPA: MoaD/ThiS family protein, partial [Propionibacteriaceae bacterium]|nr:MoaD/ThiS family protein [Propionibacteriaceae bacterium]
MLETNAMVPVSLHYWAAARAAAGVTEEEIQARTVAEALRFASYERSDPHFDRVIKASSMLIDGLTAHPADLERLLTAPVRVEILPPFAGG